MWSATKEKSSLPGSLTAFRALLCLVVAFLLAGTRAEAFFAPPDPAPSQTAAFHSEAVGKTTTACQYDALDSLIAAEGGGYLFRGDNGYRAGESIGTSGGDVTAEALIKHVQGKGDGTLKSFSTKLAAGSADSRGAKFFGDAVKVKQGNLGGVTQITPDEAFSIINSHAKKKVRVQAGNVRANMQRNNEVITHGEIPASVVEKAN